MRYGRFITDDKNNPVIPEVGFFIFKDQTDGCWYTVDSEGTVEPFPGGSSASGFQYALFDYANFQPSGSDVGTLDVTNLIDGQSTVKFFYEILTPFTGPSITNSNVFIKNTINNLGGVGQNIVTEWGFSEADSDQLIVELRVFDGLGPGVIDNLNAGEVGVWFLTQPIDIIFPGA